MNPFVMGPQKGCQLLLQKTSLAYSHAGSPSVGPREVWGLGRVLAGPWTTASTVVRGQCAALSFTRSLTLGKGEPSLDLTLSSVTWV